MVLKCKICGGDLAYQVGERIATCEYCGSKQTLPQTASDEKIAGMYERANAYRIANEFDKAANIYEQLIAENPRDGEAYWNLALCNYGVVYVQDPKSGEYIPTCNRTHYLSILKDGNYLKALEFAAPEQVAIYEKDAQYIDEVQKGIVAIAKGEKPFDIFICYKETGANGKRSKDSIKAQKLYETLTEQGYKVFFSRITLESKIGTEYEPYIYAALASSKVMLHITSCREHSDAVWVKNEWSRYLALCAKNSEKTMIPLYFEMAKEQLPDEFIHLPSYNMEEEGFEQELLRGIKKLIPTPIMRLQAKKRRKKVLAWTGAVAAVCLIAAGVIAYPYYQNYQAKMAEYNAAMQLYYDKNYPEATWAFEAIGNFKDSKEMREKAALSWRKSLASVTAMTTQNELYYITQNGTVGVTSISSNESHFGTAHQEISPGTHGKIISITSDKFQHLYALHEDGYVSNAAELNGATDDSAWQDIIKISDKFLNSNVALRADGTMVFQYSDSEAPTGLGTTSYTVPDHWMNEMKNWTDIVDFTYSYGFETYKGRTLSYAAVIGIKADGTVCSAHTFGDDLLNTLTKDFKNVKEISFCYFDGKWGGKAQCTALTRDNDILSNHETSPGYAFAIDDQGLSWEEAMELPPVIGPLEKQEGDFIDLSASKDCYLKKTGDLTELHTNSVFLKDCVYLNDHYDDDTRLTTVITRSGSIYHIPSSFMMESVDYRCEPIDAKTIVYDEWLERLE